METGGLWRSLLPAGIMAIAAGNMAAAADAGTLSEACFARTYDAAYLAAHPGHRVASMSIRFASFDTDLLASVTYKLRYGTSFGFSGACYMKVAGGFLCEACASGNCAKSGGQFEVRWAGADTIKLVNGLTGLLAQNSQGGRDYLAARGEQSQFILHKGSAAACAW